MKYVLNLQYLLLFVLGCILSQNQLQAQQSKAEALEYAVANAYLWKDYSSIAKVNRGDISPEEIQEWFESKRILGKYYRDLKISYGDMTWKWGANRPTTIEIQFLHKNNEEDFLVYWYEVREEQKRRERMEFFTNLAICIGVGYLAYGFFSTDIGKNLLLTIGKALFEKRQAEKELALAPQFTEVKTPTPTPSTTTQSRRESPPNYKIAEDWKKDTSRLSTPRETCVVSFADGRIFTITKRLDVEYYRYGYDTGFLGHVGENYDTFHNAAQAAWIAWKYGEVSPVGLKSSQKERPSSISDEDNIPDYKVVKTWTKGKERYSEIEFYGSSVVCHIIYDLEHESNTHRYGFKFNALSEGYGYDTFHHAAQAAWVYKKFNKVRTVGKR